MSERIDSRFRDGHVSAAEPVMERHINDIFARDGPHIGISDNCSTEEINIKKPIAANAVFMLGRWSEIRANGTTASRT
jgi:hypothetical protein